MSTALRTYVLHKMRMRAHFKNIDKIIATIKAATVKNKDSKKDFHDAAWSAIS